MIIAKRLIISPTVAEDIQLKWGKKYFGSFQLSSPVIFRPYNDALEHIFCLYQTRMGSMGGVWSGSVTGLPIGFYTGGTFKVACNGSLSDESILLNLNHHGITMIRCADERDEFS